MTTSDIADALQASLQSESPQSPHEGTNIVDAIDSLAQATAYISGAITADASPGHDETGGSVTSLTEAVMGITAGLCRVAESISSLAEAVREMPEQ